MIGFLRGKLAVKTDRYIIVDVNGVGYKVACSREAATEFSKEGSDIAFFTYLYVRETELDLYGFASHEELDFFELLISISGIGPKGALSILGVASLEDLRSAILSGDDTLLTKVSGIGRKTAQKIIIELKGKLEDTEIGKETTSSEDLSKKQDALDALLSLGYSQREAREALSKVPSDVKDAAFRVREALKLLGQK